MATIWYREKMNSVFVNRIIRACKLDISLYEEVEAALDEKNFDEIVVFPIAIPFIAGPSTLATIILLMGNYADSLEFQVAIIFALIAALIVSLLLIIGANYTTKYIPQQILHAISRVFAFILAALATQFIVDGVKASFNI